VYALGLIDEMHPLSRVPMYKAYPWLAPFKSCLRCLPYFQDPEEEQDTELDDLLREGQVKKTVKINGRSVAKKLNMK